MDVRPRPGSGGANDEVALQDVGGRSAALHVPTRTACRVYDGHLCSQGFERPRSRLRGNILGRPPMKETPQMHPSEQGLLMPSAMAGRLPAHHGSPVRRVTQPTTPAIVVWPRKRCGGASALCQALCLRRSRAIDPAWRLTSAEPELRERGAPCARARMSRVGAGIGAPRAARRGGEGDGHPLDEQQWLALLCDGAVHQRRVPGPTEGARHAAEASTQCAQWNAWLGGRAPHEQFV